MCLSSAEKRKQMTSFNRRFTYFRFLRIILICAGGILLGLSCEKQSTPVQPLNPQLTLTVEAGVIEAWLTVTTGEAEGMELLITRDGAERLRFAAIAETTVVDTGLLPARGYSYTALLQQAGQTVKQTSASLATMDTTSHNFSWTIDTVGIFGSLLFDVAIINENDIWAVGDIQHFDSTGQLISYNAVHWDGQQWELKQIPVKAFPNSNSTIIAALQSIIVFDTNDIFVTTGGQVIRYDGNNWGQWIFLWTDLHDTTFGGINKFWGTNNTDLWGAGDKGNIFHFDGNNWQRIESGTDILLRDISGFYDPATGEEKIYASGFSSDFQEGVVLRKSGGQWEVLDNGVDGPLSSLYYNNFASVWTSQSNVFYVTAFNRVYRVTALNDRQYRVSLMLENENGIYRIRGSAGNNIFVVGDRVKLKHFNGVNWRHFSEFDALISMDCLDVKEDIIVAADLGIIITGRRSN